MRQKILRVLSLFIFVSSCLSLSVLVKPTQAANLPVINVSGTLTANQTWINGNVYMVSNVVVPSGKTLTIQPGAIVKIKSGVNGITVNTGGTLNATGNSTTKIIFTSYRDDTYGGDSNGGGVSSGTVGDYTTAVQAGGGQVNVTFAVFRYAQYVITGGGGSTPVKVTDSILKDSTQAVDLNGGSINFKRNQITVVPTGDHAVGLYNIQGLQNFVLSGADKNILTGTGGAVVVDTANGTVSAATTWVHDKASGAVLRLNQLTVDGTFTTAPDSVVMLSNPGLGQAGLIVNGTVNLGAGTIVKNEITSGIQANDGSTVNVNGMSTKPVTFTSFRDDTVGGDNNLDGNSTVPENGNYSQALTLGGGASTVVVNFAVFKYGSAAIAGQSLGSLTVNDSSFSTKTGIDFSEGALTLKRNQFNVEVTALGLVGIADLSNVWLSGTDKNIFNGTSSQRTVAIHRSKVAVNTIWAIDGSSGVLAGFTELTIEGTATFGNGAVIKLGQEGGYTWLPAIEVVGTLNIQPGVVLKSVRNQVALSIRSGAALNAEGTASTPIIFTSYQDDAFGGDSNGDGAESTPANNDYSSAVMQSGGNILLRYAEIYFASTSILTYQTNNDMITLTDNKFTGGGLMLNGGAAGNLIIERNTISVNQGQYPIDAREVDLSAITLTGENKNIFNGTGTSATISTVDSRVASGQTWSVDSTGGLQVLYIRRALNVDGILNVSSGMTIKVDGWNSTNLVGLTVNSGGTLNISGSNSARVVITSYKDDSIGGDTSGDGPSVPGVSDWSTGIDIAEGGQASIVNTDIKYASTAYESSGALNVTNVGIANTYSGFAFYGGTGSLQGIVVDGITDALYVSQANVDINGNITNVQTGIRAEGTSKVTFRGSINGATNYAVHACNWAGDTTQDTCHVDATYVDWGSGGPFVSSPANYVCGSVNVSPWVGGTSPDETAAFDIPNCDGSSTPEQSLAAAVQGYNTYMNGLQIDCSGGFQDACDQMERTFQCLSGAVDVAKAGSPFPLPTKPTVYSAASSDIFKGDLTRNAGSYMKSSAEIAPVLSAFKLATAAGKVINLFNTLNNAYGQCR